MAAGHGWALGIRRGRRLCPLTDSSLPHVGPVPHTHLPAKRLLRGADWPGRGSESQCVRSAAQLQLTSCRLEHFPPGGFLSPQPSGVNLFLCRRHIAGRLTTYRSSQAIWARDSRADVVRAAPPPASLALALRGTVQPPSRRDRSLPAPAPGIPESLAGIHAGTEPSAEEGAAASGEPGLNPALPRLAVQSRVEATGPCFHV